jgi:hypothetical protein
MILNTVKPRIVHTLQSDGAFLAEMDTSVYSEHFLKIEKSEGCPIFGYSLYLNDEKKVYEKNETFFL